MKAAISTHRLKIAKSGPAHDIFATDVLYYKSCYNKLIYILLQQKRKRQQQPEEDIKKKKEEVIRRLRKLIEQKVLNNEKAFLLIDLLGHISDLSEEEGIEPVATSAKSLRRIIETNFEEMVFLQTVGKWLMVYFSNVDPCIYVDATLKGYGLHHDDLTRAFAKMVPKKISKNKEK